MSSRIRLQAGGDAFHLNTKAVAGARAFPDDEHRDRFMELFAEEIVLSKWRCLGYTVLGTHYHLVIQLDEASLSSGFQRLNSRYARWFNREHGRTGALWQARFFGVLIESDFQLLETQRYIALNAVRAGLVERPEDWAYCHYGALAGRYPADTLVDEELILRLLSRDRRVARARLRAYVNEADSRVRRQMFLNAKSELAQRPATRANGRSRSNS